MTDQPEPNTDPTPGSLTDEDVERLRAMIGGRSGLIDGAVPALVFVIANAVWNLTVAAILSASYGVAAVAYRAIRRQPIRHATYGLVGLTISLAIALVTRNPSAYFVPGAAWGGLMGLLLLVSALLKQPVSSMWAMALERKPKEYYARPEVLRLHMLVTAVWGLVFCARAGFRWFLISNGETELLGASAVVLGYPVTGALAAWTVLVLKRGARRFGEVAPETPSGS